MINYVFDILTVTEMVSYIRALTSLFGNGAWAYGIGKISGILGKNWEI